MATQKKYNSTEAILKRLTEFLQTAETGDTWIDIAAAIGVSPLYFSTIRSKKAEMGVDKVVKILSLYPQLSADWLLTGSGLMLKVANSLKDQSELLAKERMLKTAVDGLTDILQQLKNKPSKAKKIIRKSKIN
jgi:hypothetical protein